MFLIIKMFNVPSHKNVHKHGQNNTWLTIGSMNSKTISMLAVKDKVSLKYFHPAPILSVFLQ